MTKFSEITNFSNIFGNTYWGNFNVEDHYGMEHIFNNRDKFIVENKIKKYKKQNRRIKNIITEICENHPCSDHIESYEDYQNNLIILQSPYAKFENEKIQNLINDGWIILPDMYFFGAISMMKIFPQ